MLNDPDLQSFVSDVIEPEEELHWVGRPIPKRFATHLSNVVPPAFLFILLAPAAQMLWWQVGGAPDGRNYLTQIVYRVQMYFAVAIVFTMLCLYREALKTVYAVTNRRALILKRGKPLTLRYYGGILPRSVLCTERDDGSGDVRFAQQKAVDSDNHIITHDVDFLCIENVRAVETLLKNTSKSGSTATESKTDTVASGRVLRRLQDENMPIDPRLENIFAKEIKPGETLRWAGRPSPIRFALQPQYLVLPLFSIVWTLGAIFFPRNMVFLSEAPDSLPLRLVFILAGLLAVTASVVFYIESLTTIYAVTNRRVLIVVRKPWYKVKAYSDIDTNYLERTERADGSGHLCVSKATTAGYEGITPTIELKFNNISDVRSVERILCNTFRNY